MKSFEKTAARMVAQKDFSKYANDRLKIYNATMKINRLEHLKAMLGLEITKVTSKEEKEFNKYLLASYQNEVKRQSGILGYHKSDEIKEQAQSVAEASFHGATWSSRLWINQDVLKAKLDTLISCAMVQGTNPKQMIANLKQNVAKEITNATSVIENLVITETARVQDVAQMNSFKRNGIKFCKWIAEPTACKRCREIAERNNEYGIGVYSLDDVPLIPEHPRCRCSKAAYWVDELKNNFLNNIEPSLSLEHSIPFSYNPSSVVLKLADGKPVQYRVYDSLGKPKVDYDLTNQGAPKHHPIVPHAHDWLAIKDDGVVKYKRKKEWRKLNQNEKNNIERWLKSHERK